MNTNVKIFALCAYASMLSGCIKECYHCSEMMVTVRTYTKGTDTISITEMGFYYNYIIDTLSEKGYSKSITENTIPVDVDFCKLKEDKKQMYYEACTKINTR